ncbi:MAG: ECF transporter S component [Clostridia bacterium]|nr:ECF transporter S component [Clostridia bacterium]
MKTRRQQQLQRNRTIAVLGVSFALIVVLHALAEGFARLGLFSLALGIIPVLAISQIKNWKYGLALGAFFGVVSLLTAVIKGYAGVSVWHNVINPLVSVLPRAFVGLVCSLLGTLAAKVFARLDRDKPLEPADLPEEGEEPQPLPVRHTAGRKVGRFTRDYVVHAFIAFVGVVLNAVGFLGMLLLLARGETVPIGEEGVAFNLMYVLEFVVGTNTLIEAITFTVLVPAIVIALKKSKLMR